jgi:hypothetical protein
MKATRSGFVESKPKARFSAREQRRCAAIIASSAAAANGSVGGSGSAGGCVVANWQVQHQLRVHQGHVAGLVDPDLVAADQLQAEARVPLKVACNGQEVGRRDRIDRSPRMFSPVK